MSSYTSSSSYDDAASTSENNTPSPSPVKKGRGGKKAAPKKSPVAKAKKSPVAKQAPKKSPVAKQDIVFNVPKGDQIGSHLAHQIKAANDTVKKSKPAITLLDKVTELMILRILHMAVKQAETAKVKTLQLSHITTALTNMSVDNLVKAVPTSADSLKEAPKDTAYSKARIQRRVQNYLGKLLNLGGTVVPYLTQALYILMDNLIHKTIEAQIRDGKKKTIMPCHVLDAMNDAKSLFYFFKDLETSANDFTLPESQLDLSFFEKLAAKKADKKPAAAAPAKKPAAKTGSKAAKKEATPVEEEKPKARGGRKPAKKEATPVEEEKPKARGGRKPAKKEATPAEEEKPKARGRGGKSRAH